MLIVLGVIVGAVLVCISFADVAHRSSAVQRVPTANGGSVTIDRPGDYAIYYNAGGVTTAAIPAAQVVGPHFAYVPVRTGAHNHPSHPAPASNDHLLGQFHATQPGRYRIETGGFAVMNGHFDVAPFRPASDRLGIVGVGAGLALTGAGLTLVASHRRGPLVRPRN